MLRCINCHLNVDRMLRHGVSSLNSTLQTLLSTWTSLQQLPPEAVICQECFLRLSVHCRNGNMNAERELGHTHVCVGCGRSLLGSRRHVRYHTVAVNDPLVAIICSWDIHNEVISGDAIVCHLCWMRASRLQSHDASRAQEGTDHHAEIESQQVDPEPSSPQERPDSTQSIVLSHYKRTVNTSRHCIFQGCANQSGHLIPLFIKVMLLRQFHIYVPVYSRVCESHLYANDWALLTNNNNLINSFTADQIEDLTSVLERNTESFDFENVQEMPNHICHYFTGLTVLEFLTLYNEIPILENVSRGKTCLAIYLSKLRTGDSNNRLSSLYNMPRSTLESYLKKMRNYFKDHLDLLTQKGINPHKDSLR